LNNYSKRALSGFSIRVARPEMFSTVPTGEKIRPPFYRLPCILNTFGFMGKITFWHCHRQWKFSCGDLKNAQPWYLFTLHFLK